MDTTTTFCEVSDSILTNQKALSSEVITEEDKINEFLDEILELQKFLHKLNPMFCSLFDKLDTYSNLTPKNEEEFKSFEDVLNSLSDIALSSNKLFARISKRKSSKVITDDILDLRLNIRTLKEYLLSLKESKSKGFKEKGEYDSLYSLVS